MTQRNGSCNWVIGMVGACILLGGSTLAKGQVRVGVGIAMHGLGIGIDIPAYPQLVPIPGYPVYYAPGLSKNLFFYDGLYWVLVENDWYYSSWYDGPWYLAEPELVPDFILRIPILYYRSPPAYFLHWNRAAPPRWGEHWGRAWQERRRGWDRWDRAAVPPRAPLPNYQRQYPRGRYPGAGEQRTLENRYYRYRPREPRDRSRLERSPQFGRRIAPQPSRPAPERRRPGVPPQARRVSPGNVQRPPAFSPSPPAASAERSPNANRPGGRPNARPAQPRGSSAPAGRQERRKEPPPREKDRGQPREKDRGQRPPPATLG
jgi:hypothetical protein